MLQPGLQYSKVTTGRVCAFRKVGDGGTEAVMGRQMKLSLCSHVYSTFFHHVHTNTPLPTHTHTPHSTMVEFTHLCVVLNCLA